MLRSDLLKNIDGFACWQNCVLPDRGFTPLVRRQANIGYKSGDLYQRVVSPTGPQGRGTEITVSREMAWDWI